MAPTDSPATSRTSPMKLATPPMSARPLVSAAISAPMSKSSCCTRIIELTAGHRREQCNLIALLHRVVGADIFLIDGNAHDGAVGERRGMLGAPLGEPVQQGAHRAHARGGLDLLLADTDFALYPSEIEDAHAGVPICCLEVSAQGRRV